MADFCRNCSERIGLPFPDIIAPPGETIWELCEGCGWGEFDDQGRRVESNSPLGDEVVSVC